MRTTMKQLRNGRIDAEIVIMDATRELIAVSHHATLVSVEQGTAEENELVQKAKI